MLATSGVLARHPRLHVVFVEYDAGWLGWTMDTIDYYNVAFSVVTTTTQSSAKLARRDGPTRKVIYPEPPEPPSAYLRRQLHATFQDDRVAVRNVDVTGAASLLWGFDSPHDEGTYPHSRATTDRLAALVDPADTDQIFGGAAAELFGFGPAIFTEPI